MTESVHDFPKEEETCVSVSYLPEQEEYVQKVMLSSRYASHPKLGMLLRITGCVLFLAGLGLLLFTSRSTSGIILFNVMMIVGIVCLVWTDMIIPMLRRNRAKAVFEKSELQKNSVMISIYGNRVAVQSDGLDMAFPLENLPFVLEDDKLFLLSAGDQYQWMIPKRVLDKGQMEWLRNTFTIQCNDRYVRFA